MKTVAKARILVTRFPFESQWGGEELHTLKLMLELDKRGFEAVFMGSCPELLKAFEENGFEVKKTWLGKAPVTKLNLFLFTAMSPILFLKAGWDLWRAKKRWQIDTLYALSFGEKLLMTPWALWMGMNVFWLEHARIGKWLTQNPWRCWYRWWSKWTCTIVTSRAMLPKLAPWAQHVRSIPCGVITEPKENLKKEWREFLEKGRFKLGVVARLSVDKGVDKVVRIVQSKPDVRLIVVGKGPMEAQLKKMIPSGQALFIPSMSRPQLMGLYEALDLLIMPSTQMDPFGMVAAEAMWHGTPAMVSRLCGISEDLHDGKEALVVNPTVRELDKGLKKMMRDSTFRKEIGLHGQGFVRRHYKLSDMVDKFERVLTK